ncbi:MULTISPECIES: hypothetical protein [Enterobacteriaceae]|nr:hypothetical protein [Enterobacter kobei]OOV68512.1 hypothetical protein B1742_25580 [Enterobacter kobei]
MSFEDFFKAWDKLSSIKPDFILFIGFVFLVFKFKDVLDCYYRIKCHRSEQLKEARLLLELSGNLNSHDMKIINSLLRGAALSLATNGVKERYRDLCYYLMHLSAKEELHIDDSIFKCIRFIDVTENKIVFNKDAFDSWLRTCIFIFVMVGFFLLFFGYNGWGFTAGQFNIAWLMNVITTLFMVLSAYVFLFLKPDSGDIKMVDLLLSKTSVVDFCDFKKMA